MKTQKKEDNNFPECNYQFSILPFTRNTKSAYLEGILRFTMKNNEINLQTLDTANERVNLAQIKSLNHLIIPSFKIYSSGSTKLIKFFKSLQVSVKKIDHLRIDVHQNSKKGQKFLCANLLSLYKLKPHSVTNLCIEQVSHFDEELITKLFQQQYLYVLTSQGESLVTFNIVFTMTTQPQKIIYNKFFARSLNNCALYKFQRLKNIQIKLDNVNFIMKDQAFWEFFLEKSIVQNENIQSFQLDLQGCILQEQFLKQLFTAQNRHMKSLKIDISNSSGFRLESVLQKAELIPMKMQIEQFELSLSGLQAGEHTINYLNNLVNYTKSRLKQVKFDLSQCGLSLQNLFKLPEMFKNSSLCKLDICLGSNPLVLPNLEIMKQLISSSQFLTSFQIDLSSSQLKQYELEDFNINLPSLRDLSINLTNVILRSQLLIMRFMEDFAYLRHLTLKFSNCRLRDETISQLIVKISKLKYLFTLKIDVRYNIIGSQTQESIKKLKNLKNLINFHIKADLQSERSCYQLIPCLPQLLRYKQTYQEIPYNIATNLFKKRKTIIWIQFILSQCNQIRNQPQGFIDSFWKQEFMIDSLKFIV